MAISLASARVLDAAGNDTINCFVANTSCGLDDRVSIAIADYVGLSCLFLMLAQAARLFLNG